MLTLQPFSQLMRFKPQIDAIGERCSRPHLLSEIVVALANERAFLFADGDSFCVLRPLICDGEKVVEVWAAHGKRGNEIRSHEAQARELALKVGAKYIQFWTVLPALNALAKRRGYELYSEYQQFTIWRVPL